MGKRGPKTGTRQTQEHRDRIRNSMVLSRLIGHAEGHVEMTPSQVTAGLGLIRKYLPDLSNATLEATEGNGPAVLLIKFEGASEE